MRKVLLVAVALILLCTSGCAKKYEASSTTTTVTETTTTTTVTTTATTAVAEDVNLDDLVTARRPADKLEKLQIFFEETEKKFNAAHDTAIETLFAGDETYLSMEASWKEELYGKDGNSGMRAEINRLTGLAEADREAFLSDYDAAMDSDMISLRELWNRIHAFTKDPETAITAEKGQLDFTVVETDGSWPEGYFFSEIIPPLPHFDDLEVSRQGEETMNIEGGMECVFTVYIMTAEEYQDYFARIEKAGARQLMDLSTGTTSRWVGECGSKDDGTYMLLLLTFDETAEGSYALPQFTLGMMNWDYISLAGY